MRAPLSPPRPTGKEAHFVKMAYEYAQKGYATLALSYFDFPSTKQLSIKPPRELVGVDLKKITEAAITKMRSFDFVDEYNVGIYGNSRGGEHVLLLASLVSPTSKGAPNYVVSISPTAYIWGGISKESAEKFKRDETFEWPRLFAWSYDETVIAPDYIAFEKITVPFFISTFKTDNVWNSKDDLIDIKDRLIAYNIDFVEKDFAPNIKATSLQKSTNILFEIPLEGHCYPDKILFPTEAQALEDVVFSFICSHSSP